MSSANRGRLEGGEDRARTSRAAEVADDTLTDLSPRSVRILLAEMDKFLGIMDHKFGTRHQAKAITRHPERGSLSFRVEVSIDALREGSRARTPSEIAFVSRAGEFGLDPDWLHHSFEDWKGQCWQIAGLRPRARRYPVILRAVQSSSEIWVSAAAVRAGMGTSPKGLLPPPGGAEGERRGGER